MIRGVKWRNRELFQRLSSPALYDRATSEALDTALNVIKTEVQVVMTPDVKTGEMRNAVTVTKMGPRKGHIGNSAAHALWVDKGTGIYGPSARPIVPRSSNRMRWFPSTATGAPTGKEIFARSVKGQKAKNYYSRALKNKHSQALSAFHTTFMKIIRSQGLGGGGSSRR